MPAELFLCPLRGILNLMAAIAQVHDIIRMVYVLRIYPLIMLCLAEFMMPVNSYPDTAGFTYVIHSLNSGCVFLGLG